MTLIWVISFISPGLLQEDSSLIIFSLFFFFKSHTRAVFLFTLASPKFEVPKWKVLQVRDTAEMSICGSNLLVMATPHMLCVTYHSCHKHWDFQTMWHDLAFSSLPRKLLPLPPSTESYFNHSYSLFFLHLECVNSILYLFSSSRTFCVINNNLTYIYSYRCIFHYLS